MRKTGLHSVAEMTQYAAACELLNSDDAFDPMDSVTLMNPPPRQRRFEIGVRGFALVGQMTDRSPSAIFLVVHNAPPRRFCCQFVTGVQSGQGPHRT